MFTLHLFPCAAAKPLGKEVRRVQRLGFGAWPCSRQPINTVLGPKLMRLGPQGAEVRPLYGYGYTYAMKLPGGATLHCK